MTDGCEDDLDRLYANVKAGMSSREFLQQHAAIFPFIHCANLTHDYRLARGRLKRLRDELTPAARFFRFHANHEDRVQFPLDNSIPDCNWLRVSGEHARIEITTLQARERLNLMTELNDTGIGRGFIGISDDKPTKDFVDAMNQERQMYATEQAKEKMAKAVSLCVCNKMNSHGDIILIEGPLHWLRADCWEELTPRLRELVRPLSFPGIYLVGDDYDNSADVCLQLR